MIVTYLTHRGVEQYFLVLLSLFSHSAEVPMLVIPLSPPSDNDDRNSFSVEMGASFDSGSYLSIWTYFSKIFWTFAAILIFIVGTNQRFSAEDSQIIGIIYNFVTLKGSQKQKPVGAAARIGKAKAKDEEEDAEILWQPPKEVKKMRGKREEGEGIMPSSPSRAAAKEKRWRNQKVIYFGRLVEWNSIANRTKPFATHLWL